MTNHPSHDPECQPERMTFEELLGHLPRNKLIATSYIHEAQQAIPDSPEDFKAECLRQYRIFKDNWNNYLSKNLDQAVSAGRVDRAFVERVVAKMLAGDWTDAAFIQEMLKEVEAVDDPHWADGLNFPGQNQKPPGN